MLLLSACAKTLVASPKEGPQLQTPGELAAPATSQPAPPNDITFPDGTWVVLKGWPTLRTAVDGGQSVRHPSWSTQGARWPRELVGLTYRLLRITGDSALVETPGFATDPRPCRSAAYHFRGLRLRFFVSRSELSTVTTARVNVPFGGPSQVLLEPGVPVSVRDPSPGPTGLLRGRVFADGLDLEVTVPAGALGLWFTLASPVPTPPTTHVVKREVRMGFGNTSTQVGWYGTSGRDRKGNANVYAARTDGDRTHVELRGACGVYRGFVDSSDIVAAAPILPSSRWPDPSELGDYRPNVGARVWDWDGREIGVAVKRPWQQGEAISAAGRLCFDHALDEFAHPERAPVPGESLRLCFDRADLEASPALRSDDDAAKVGPRTTEYWRLELANQTPFSTAKLVTSARKAVKRLDLRKPGQVALAPPDESAAQTRGKRLPAGVERKVVRVAVTTQAKEAKVEVTWFYVAPDSAQEFRSFGQLSLGEMGERSIAEMIAGAFSYYPFADAPP